MVHDTKWLRLARLVAGCSLGLAAAVSTAQAAPVTPASVDGVQHFMNCFGLLIHDSAAHAEYCGPSGVVPSNGSLGTVMTGGGVACPSVGDVNTRANRDNSVASLDPMIGIGRTPPALLGINVACGLVCYTCSNSADRDLPAFETYDVASLDDQLEAPAAKAGLHALQLACCPAPN